MSATPQQHVQTGVSYTYWGDDPVPDPCLASRHNAKPSPLSDLAQKLADEHIDHVYDAGYGALIVWHGLSAIIVHSDGESVELCHAGNRRKMSVHQAAQTLEDQEY